MPIDPRFIDTRESHLDVEKQARTLKCMRHPNQRLTVGITPNGESVVQCYQCNLDGEEHPAFVNQNRAAERTAKMVETHLAVRDQQIDALAVADIRALLPVGKASDAEVAGFIKFCQGSRLNPFLREVYLVKYQDGQPASIVIGYQHFLQVGSESPRYAGHRSGITVQNKGEQPSGGIIKRTGEGLRPGDTLWGAWIEIHRKGFAVPYEHEITVAENTKQQAVWRTSPALMIHKTIVGRGMKAAFPGEFAGTAAITAEGFEVYSEDNAPPEIVEAIEAESHVIQYPDAGGPDYGAGDLMCPVHKTEWFKRGKMPKYAHPVDGEEGPRGGKVWCNMEEVLASLPTEAVDDTAENDADVASEPESVLTTTDTPETQPTGDSEQEEAPEFLNLGGLLVAALTHGWSRDDVARANALPDGNALKDAVDGGADLKQIWQQTVATLS